MADYYCDHGAYASALGTTPTWGVPQEGDGSATTAATASSVASILFNAVPTTGNFVICGVTFASPAGVLDAASVDAAANALAGLINGSTTTVGSSVAVGTPQLRNLVYARGPADGAPGGTCQVMMRVGSTTLNHASNSNVALSHTFNGTAPTVVQFIGGAGGCWGWAFNGNTALGVGGSYAALSYGVLYGGGMAVRPASVSVDADTVFFRTSGGASKEIVTTVPGGSAPIVFRGLNARMVHDSNTKWTGDSGTGTLRLKFSVLQQYTSIRLAPTSSASDVYGAMEAVALGGFELEYHSPGDYYAASVSFNNPDAHSDSIWSYSARLRFIDNGPCSNVQGPQFTPFGQYTGYSLSHHEVFEECVLDVVTPRAVVRTLPMLGQTNYGFVDVRLRGCKLNLNINGPGNPGPLFGPPGYDSASFDVQLEACTFTGYASGYTLANYSSTLGGMMQGRLVADNCSGLKLPDTYLGLQSTGYGGRHSSEVRKVFSQTSVVPGAGQGFRIELQTGVAEWLPNAAVKFPTLSAINALTGTAWSIRLLLLQSVGLSRARSLASPDLQMLTTSGSGQKTVTLEVFIPSALAAEVLRMMVGYTNVAGETKTESTSTLQASGASWADTEPFTGYVAKKLSLVTSDSVAANSRVVCTLHGVGTPPSAVTEVYLDPEFLVTAV